MSYPAFSESPVRATFRPSLSLAMIVKNEERTLERCLKAARPHVDEIVIVDTGSTDGTLEIARRYADVLDEIEWPGSFATARNHSLELANRDFIIVLDGDEYIEQPEAWRRIRDSLGVLDIAAVQLPVRNLLDENGVVSADLMWQERILRNTPDIRYHGKVHNQVMESILDHAEQTGRKVVRVEAEVVHTGYALSKDKMAAKYSTRLELLQAEYENPRSEIYRAYYAYQLGLIYYILRRDEDAIALFNTLDYTLLSPGNAFYTRLLGAQTAMRMKDYNTALVHCNGMLAVNPGEPVAYYITGIALIRARQVHNGMLMLLEAFNVNEQAGADIRFQINPVVFLEHAGRACEGVGLSDYAALFRKLALRDPFEPSVAKSLVQGLQAGLARAESKDAAARRPAGIAVESSP